MWLPDEIRALACAFCLQLKPGSMCDQQLGQMTMLRRIHRLMFVCAKPRSEKAFDALRAEAVRQMLCQCKYSDQWNNARM